MWLMWPGSLNRLQFAMVLSRAVSLAPLLFFNIFYAAMLLDAFHNNDIGINVHYLMTGEFSIFGGFMPNPKSPSCWHGIFYMQTIGLWSYTHLKMHK